MLLLLLLLVSMLEASIGPLLLLQINVTVKQPVIVISSFIGDLCVTEQLGFFLSLSV